MKPSQLTPLKRLSDAHTRLRLAIGGRLLTGFGLGLGVFAVLSVVSYSNVRHFADANVVVAGGPAITSPDDSPRQRASGAIFASAIVTATTRHRYVAETQRDVESLASCNLLVRRDAFLRDAEASIRYWPGEDILLCMFASRNGARIVYDPTALVYHHRRTVFAAHLRQVWNYGRFRGFFLRRLSASPRYRVYAIPAAFVLAHAVLLAAYARWRLRTPATPEMSRWVSPQT